MTRFPEVKIGDRVTARYYESLVIRVKQPGEKDVDSGGMSVTGANGLLDRVDALCFAAPIFFHAVRWYFGVDAGVRQ